MIIEDNELKRVIEEDIVNGTVVIPEGVTKIAGDAFILCKNMISSVKIPESVKYIGAGAFLGSTNLTSIDLPKGLTVLGADVFSECSSLTSINIPESITYIPPYTFRGCSSLTSVNLPNSIDEIGQMAFQGCTSLTNIQIPESVTKIRNSVFDGCTELTSVDIPQGVEMIESDTFNGCTMLSSISIPESVTTIGKRAFQNCQSLIDTRIPDGVTSVGECAFQGCDNLTNVNIPKGVTRLPNYVFAGCRKLTNVHIPKGVTSIGNGAFETCSKLVNIDIPNSVTQIGLNAFEYCSGLTSVNIPDSVINIGGSAFNGCSELTSIDIPEGVDSIEIQTFKNCSKLTSVNIPKSVTSIENNAFDKCSGLTSVNIPEGVTYIGDDAFRRCSKLTSINIPEGVTSIGTGTFRGCSELTSINIPDSVNSIGSLAFSDCGELTSVNIPNSVISIKPNTFSGCSELTSINIPEGIESIGNGAFRDCSKLTSIDLPNSVISIDRYAFSDCSKLNSINIPKGVTIIRENTFNGCRGLTNIEIPEGVTDIRRGAFSQCTGLTSINIPEGVTSIGIEAFGDCVGLNSVTIPDSLTNIGEDCFERCLNIKEVNTSKDFYKNENALFVLYDQMYGSNPISLQKLMYGNNLEKFNEIKKQAHFGMSYDYDADFMDKLYHKIIYSVGLDELERMVKIPGLNADNIERYKEAFKRKEESFNNLYEEKQIIDGDLGTVTSILKQLALNVNNNENGKNSDELDILKQVNLLLDKPDSEITSLKDLIYTAMQNAGYDSSKIVNNIEELQRSLNKSQFQSNMDNVRDDIVEALSSNDTSFGEQLASLQVDAIEKIIEDKLRKIYMVNSKVSIENLRAELLDELGDSSHALYIRQNANNIASRFINLLDSNEEFKKKINYNSVDALKTVRAQIGGRWIDSIKKAFKAACNGQNIESIPDEFSLEQIDILKEKLNIDIKTNLRAVLKKGADKEEAYELLEEIQSSLPEEERLIVTYKQLHDMFGGVHYPYSEEFKKFFKINREEFLRNPKYIYEFAPICNNFESIINSPELKNIYLNGKLEIDDILAYLGKLKFENQRPGDEKLAQLSSSIGKIATDKQFADVQAVFDIVKNRERTSIPPVFVQEQKSKFRGRMLSPNDILTMFAGNITDCCQKFGDAGMGAMLLGAIEENAGIFVVEELQENGTYQIVGQSLTIRQKGKDGNYDRLTFDNIEITENVSAKLSRADEMEILGIYQKAGKQAMDLDKKFLQQQLKDGKITQEDYDNLVLKEAIAGRGYNDLSTLNSLQTAQTVVPDEAYYRYRSKEWGNIRPWIDSTEQGAPTGSNTYKPVIIAEMEAEKLEKINARRSESSKKISDITNIPLWYGKVDEPVELSNEKITEQQIETIKGIERKVYRPQQQLLNNEGIRDYEDMQYEYDLKDISTVIGSQNNWYMIYGRGKKGECMIQDLALEGGLNSGKNKESAEKQSSSRLATVEMANEVYSLMIKKAKEETKIVCNATKDTSLINIKNMIKKGIAEVCDSEGKKIVISDNGELIYEDGNEISYRNFESGSYDRDAIQMLDLEIKPNIERMIEEKIKLESYLGLARRMQRMKPTEKEKGIDEKRRAIRDDLQIG